RPDRFPARRRGRRAGEARAVPPTPQREAGMSRAELAASEAAEWLIAQADGPLSPEDEARFRSWLEASDGNKAAYWRLEFGWEEASRLSALGPGGGFAAESVRGRGARR